MGAPGAPVVGAAALAAVAVAVDGVVDDSRKGLALGILSRQLRIDPLKVKGVPLYV